MGPKYRPLTTGKKAIEPCISIAVVITVIRVVARKLEIELDDDAALGFALGTYGFFRGLLNWWKHH